VVVYNELNDEIKLEPIYDGELVVDYLEDQKERDERVAQIISSMKEQEGVTLDFIANCKAQLNDGGLSDYGKDYVMSVLESF